LILRRKIQVFSLIALNSSLFFEIKSFCMPVLNCHSCPIALFACPIGVLGQFSALHIFPFFILGILILFGVLLGRLFCGWACPFGLFQELLYKIPSHKITISKRFEHSKYFILILTVWAVPFLWGTDSLFFFCKICPPGTLQSAIPWAFIKGNVPEVVPFILRIMLLLSIIGLITSNERSFCKIICPLGAFMGIFNKISLFFIKKDDRKCNNCGDCEKVCPMGVTRSNDDILEKQRSLSCILCLRCSETCKASRKIGVSI